MSRTLGFTITLCVLFGTLVLMWTRQREPTREPRIGSAANAANAQPTQANQSTRVVAERTVVEPTTIPVNVAPTAALTASVTSTSPAPTPVPPTLAFDPRATRTGDATMYYYNKVGNCTLDPLPEGTFLVAMNGVDYADARLCGAYLEATGPRGTIRVIVADQCPECRSGDLDLNLPAFQALTGESTGRFPVSWRIISPPLDGPIAYRFQGSNQFYAKVQVLNHRNPVYRMEVQAPSGDFVPLDRVVDNFFVIPDGAIPEPYGRLTLRVTDIYGNTITDSGIAIINDVKIPGSGQFPAAP